MKQITVVLHAPSDAEVLLPQVVLWAQEEALQARVLVRSAPGQSYVAANGSLQMQSLTELEEMMGELDSWPEAKRLIKSMHAYPPGGAVGALRRYASTTDMFVLSATAFQAICPLEEEKGCLRGLSAPVLIPGQAYTATGPTVLLAEPASVKLAMQGNRRLLASQKMTILSCNAHNPEEDRHLVEYVQAHYKGPGYYFLPHEQEANPPVQVMAPGALVVGTLDPTASSYPFLRRLLLSEEAQQYSFLLHP